MSDLTLLGAIHAAVACFVIAVGALQLLRRKGDSAHRAIGYAYVYALLVVDGTAMLVFQFTGRLNILHFGVIANLICISFGMWPVLRAARRPNFRMVHYIWMSWSYVGVLAAAGTEIVVRGPFHIQSHAMAWMATAIMTIAVTVTGWLLIERNRPAALPSA